MLITTCFNQNKGLFNPLNERKKPVQLNLMCFGGNKKLYLLINYAFLIDMYKRYVSQKRTKFIALIATSLHYLYVSWVISFITFKFTFLYGILECER
jgi:hypothetical protein